MRFQETLQKQYQKHLGGKIVLEKLDQAEIERLLKVVNEIRDIMSTTNYKVDVLQFLFDHIMEETNKCGKCGDFEEDELVLTPGEVNAVNVASTLSKDKAKGGLMSTLTGGLVGDPTKNIQKAYGDILNALSQRLTAAAQKMKQGDK